MPPRQPRRHHTVPRLYLRAFAEGNQILMRLRGRTTDEIRNITSVAFTRDFYAFTLGGVRDATVEDWLQRNVEDPGALALRRLVDGQWPPTDEDRAVIATLAAFQLLRTPLARDYMHQIDRVTAPLLWAAEVVKKALEQDDLTDAEKRQVFENARARTPAALTERADPRALLRTMLREADRQAPRLLARSWTPAGPERGERPDRVRVVLGQVQVEVVRGHGEGPDPRQRPAGVAAGAGEAAQAGLHGGQGQRLLVAAPAPVQVPHPGRGVGGPVAGAAGGPGPAAPGIDLTDHRGRGDPAEPGNQDPEAPLPDPGARCRAVLSAHGGGARAGR